MSRPADVEALDGEALDGEALDGEALDGGALDVEASDGESTTPDHAAEAGDRRESELILSVPATARTVFGARSDVASAYARLLAGDGVAHGHLGPREVPRLWERHLVNCALVAELLPRDAHVVDVGSGAGLPGIPIAIRRPDLRVTLVEPMLRRTRFLSRAVGELELDAQIDVVRGRAEDAGVRQAVGEAPWVVARAVAPLDRLAGWCLPLLAPGGTLLALKGMSAQDEVAEHATSLRRLGASMIGIEKLGDAGTQEPTWVVRVVAAHPRARRPRRSAR